MLIYGRNTCLEVFKKNIKVDKVFLQDNFNDKEIMSYIQNRKYTYKSMPKDKMTSLVNGVHQGIIVSVPEYQYSALDTIWGENKIVVMLDHIEDPHNFGAIIRTCEAAGVDAVIIPNKRSVTVNSTVAKTSVGTIYDIDIIQVSNLVNTIKVMKEHNYWFVGTSLDSNLDYRKVDYTGNICLIVGNEGEGITNLVAKNCDYITKIPMYGHTNSLNASVATGIMIYEIVRNRK